VRVGVQFGNTLQARFITLCTILRAFGTKELQFSTASSFDATEISHFFCGAATFASNYYLYHCNNKKARFFFRQWRLLLATATACSAKQCMMILMPMALCKMMGNKGAPDGNKL
jgi:hypothetical protein